jgi:hypothetical protein
MQRTTTSKAPRDEDTIERSNLSLLPQIKIIQRGLYSATLVCQSTCLGKYAAATSCATSNVLLLKTIMMTVQDQILTTPAKEKGM